MGFLRKLLRINAKNNEPIIKKSINSLIARNMLSEVPNSNYSSENLPPYPSTKDVTVANIPMPTYRAPPRLPGNEKVHHATIYRKFNTGTKSSNGKYDCKLRKKAEFKEKRRSDDNEKGRDMGITATPTRAVTKEGITRKAMSTFGDITPRDRLPEKISQLQRGRSAQSMHNAFSLLDLRDKYLEQSGNTSADEL